LFELARRSFKIIERSLRYDIIMAICRLSDPPESDENLSLEYLVNNYPDDLGLNELLANFKIACKPVRKYRNKLVGHKDLKTALDARTRELLFTSVTAEKIELILKLASSILIAVFQIYDHGDLNFHTVAQGDGESLIFYLNAGKQLHAHKFPSRNT